MPLHSLPSADTGEKVPDRLFIVYRQKGMELPQEFTKQAHVVNGAGLEMGTVCRWFGRKLGADETCKAPAQCGRCEGSREGIVNVYED